MDPREPLDGTLARQPAHDGQAARRGRWLMFGFGYALVPMYKAICDALGINVLSVSERGGPVSEQRAGQHAGRHRPHGDHRVRRQRARTVGLQARAAFGAGAPGRSGDRDVRVPQRAEPHDGGAGDPELRADELAMRTSTSSSASASTNTRLQPGESRAVAGGVRRRREAAEGRDDDHLVVHLLRGRRQGADADPLASRRGRPAAAAGRS